MSTAAVPESANIFSAGVKRAPAARLGVLVVQDLVSTIVAGGVREGESLPPEADLAAHFGVSRTVIRESVKRLEEKGLVTVVQGRGTEVAPSSQWNILDKVVISSMIENDQALGILDELAVVRSDLESSMAAAAATRRTEAEMDTLRAALQAMVDTAADTEAFSEADKHFHSVVMDISGNGLARAIARTLVQRASDNSRFHGSPGPDAFELTLSEHGEILRGVVDGDPEKASAAMRDHITQAWERRRLPREA